MPTQQQQQPPPKPRVIMDPHHHRQPMSPRGQRPAGAVKDIRQTKEYKLAARR